MQEYTEIEISARVAYLPDQSEPDKQRYAFAYTITMHNRGEVAAQLKERHWWIDEGEGSVREVHGPGVVGEHPTLLPGQKYRYTSGAVLHSPVGAMSGYYRFETAQGTSLRVPIPQFTLAIPRTVH